MRVCGGTCVFAYLSMQLICLLEAAEVIHDSHQSASEHLMTSLCLNDITAAQLLRSGGGTVVDF